MYKNIILNWKAISSVILISVFTVFSVSAEIKNEYKLEDDGFEWYEISDTGTRKKGVQDLQGNQIVPVKFDEVQYVEEIKYEGRILKPAHFRGMIYAGIKNPCWPDENLKVYYKAMYTPNGKCIVPIEREFVDYSWNEHKGKLYFSFVRGKDFHEYGVCDANGKILFKRSMPYYVVHLLLVSSHYVMHYLDNNGKRQSAIMGFDHEPFEYSVNGNLPHPLANAPAKWNDSPGNDYSSSRNSSKSDGNINSNNGSSNNNQGNQVQKYIETVPLQVWQSCGGCNGSGQCGVCYGSGWILSYNGDKRLCTACHGNGKCTSCAGHGGQNVVRYEQRTVYR